MKTLGVLLAILAALFLFVILGLQVKPRAFPAYPGTPGELETVPLPSDLPILVAGFYEAIYGEEIPLITSAVITGRATLRPVANIPLPGRFRFTHAAGQDYRHYIEATFFGYPLLKVDEHFIGGRSRLELPFGVAEDSPKLDQAANLGLWAESFWLPAIFITDPRTRWEAVDETSALLVVPFGEEEERLLVRFDPETSLPRYIEAMRYKDEDSPEKSLWICEAIEWGYLDGRLALRVGALTWFGDPGPWAVFTVEDIVYNVDISEYLKKKGI